MISQSDQAVMVLQELIETGELKPGTMVSERGLMERLGLGRTPVREAIQQLALAHMLRIHPSRGIEVPAMSVEDQLSGLEVRRATEALAVALACERASTGENAAIAALAAELDGDFALPAYVDTVRRTHRLIIDAAHNPYLDAVMTPLQALSRRFWVMHLREPACEVARGKALHRALLAGVAARDIEAAQAASRALNDYLVGFAVDVVASRARGRA
ncbi:GntR family transcriptional regulator [Ancylobacter sp. 6x-1]|uniref:GntR family transcriptional regulator n=1 Tax=Ancylobacter crimeensis TaxID=2579147 RepID=A0ABT0DEK4_9HYPH|nr:GntR family transcriptional regulator [Ancylobacter crimeensis]MCK0198389.1 GntR family transcriptional regulator [Ancylobacter crimeensis]